MDVAKAFDLILHKGMIGEIYNIGTHREYKNIEVAHALIKAFGREAEQDKIIKFVPDRAFNDVRYYIDSSKLHGLGWKPLVEFEEGIKMTMDWYAANPDHWDSASLNSALRAHPVFINPLTGKRQC